MDNTNNEIKVKVKNLAQYYFTVTTSPAETIEAFKKKVRKAFKVPENQELRLSHDAKQLEDQKTIGDYNIKDGSNLILITFLKENTSPNTQSSNSIQVESIQTDSLIIKESASALHESTTKNISTNKNAEPGKFKVKTFSQTYEIADVNENTTVGDLRNKVAKNIGVDTARVRLIYMGKDLSNANLYDANHPDEKKSIKDCTKISTRDRITDERIQNYGVIMHIVLKLQSNDNTVPIKIGTSPSNTPSEQNNTSIGKKILTVLLYILLALLVIAFLPIVIPILCCCCRDNGEQDQQPSSQITDQQQYWGRLVK